MKNDRNKPTFKHSLLGIALSVLLSTGIYAQKEVAETIKIETGISPSGTLEFTNNSFDTQIKTWSNAYVQLQMEVKLVGDKEDVETTLEALRGLCFEGTENNRSVNTKFWESMISSGFNHKIKLISGDRVTLKKYTVKNTLYIPKTISMIINNKYADIEMEEIAGKATLKIYNGKLICGSIGGKVLLDLKYSKTTMNNVPEASMKLYDSDIQMKTCGNLEIESKYANVQIERAGNLKFDSYDDDFKIGQLGSINGSAKYSDFNLGPSKDLTFDFYDCDLQMGETGEVIGQSKYSEFTGKKTGKFMVTSSYDDNWTFDEADSFDCRESKYSEFRFGMINKGLSIISYDDTFSVNNFSTSFTGIKLESKYSDFNFTIPASVPYILNADTKYGKLVFPEEQFDKKIYIKDNDKVNLEGRTKNSTENTNIKIEVKSYDSNILIRN